MKKKLKKRRLFRTLYADPPWNESGGGRIKRGADRHYKLMKTKEIIILGPKIQKVIADDAHCYLWVTNNFLKDGLAVMEAWGFRYITMITWAKHKFGLGQYFRGQTEHCLFGVRGRLPYKLEDGKRSSCSTLLVAPKRKHSQKPEEMYELIERVSYMPYLELFARSPRDFWQVYGDEVEGSIKL